MLVIADVEDDGGASGLGGAVVGIGIVDDEVAGLRFDTADLIGLLEVLCEAGTVDRQHHEHVAAEGQVGIEHSAVIVGDNLLLLKSERRTQPVDSRRHSAIAQCGYKPCSGRVYFRAQYKLPNARTDGGRPPTRTGGWCTRGTPIGPRLLIRYMPINCAKTTGKSGLDLQPARVPC